MSESGSPALTGTPSNQKPFTELRVTAHMMNLDPGLFCIVQTPNARRADDGSGLPGVRISLPPATRPQAVSITTFRPDGYLNGQIDAALVRVSEGPAQILVTIYQSATGADTAPRLQVLRLGEDVQAARPATTSLAQPSVAQPPVPQMPGAAPPAGAMQPRSLPDMIAHVQVRGDVGATLGDWIGERGSKRWIEGFAIAPQKGPITAKDLEYQAVLGRGWLSPWVEGGQLCGSRGMALPVLGLRVRLRGEAAEKFDCACSATFTDGTAIGPVAGGEPCEAESLAPMEAFQVVITPHVEANAAERSLPRVGAKAGETADARTERRLPARAKPEPEPVSVGVAAKRGGGASTGRRTRA